MSRYPYNKKYFNFLKQAKNERKIVMQGSRRSGKTVAIIQKLEMDAIFGDIRSIALVSENVPKSRDLRRTFTEVTGAETYITDKYGHAAQIGNCIFQFRSFDDWGKAQGTQAEEVFYNECNRLKVEMVRTFNLGITGKQYYDFNPANRFWIDDIITDTNFLKTTWRDNPYLTESQKEEFLEMERKAESADATTLDKYMRDVYCLGIYGTTTGGLIYPHYQIITDAEYAAIMAMEIVGNDWGASTTQRDPDTFIGTKRCNGNLYLHEYLYANDLSDVEIAEQLDEQWGDDVREIAFETATDGETRKKNIKRLMQHPHNWRKCHKGKGSVMAGIKNVSQYKTIYVTESSANVIRELDNYSWEEISGVLIPQDKYNHAMDAIRYAEDFYLRKYGNVNI